MRVLHSAGLYQVCQYVLFRWDWDEFGGERCSAVTSMVVILMSASIYNFVLVNLDRLLVFKCGFLHRAYGTSKNYMIGMLCD